MAESFEVELVRIRTLSQTTRDFRFRRLDGADMVFTPGEFFRFTFNDASGSFERPYSLCNFSDAQSDELDLVISTVDGGRASELLFDCTIGLNAKVVGPYGRLVLPDKLPSRLFLVATSVGIAPFLPMLQPLRSRVAVSGTEVVLLFGIRDRSEFLYRDELLALCEPASGIELHVCYSREVDSLQDREHRGYVSDALAGFAPNPEHDRFMLCGNPQMIDDIFGSLKDQGFTARQVIREKYVFASQPKTAVKPALSEEQKRLIAEKLRKYR
jgi:ferredoxin-NADP reductase